MVQKFGDVFWYDDDMELIVEEFYANLTQEQANLSFANLLLEPVMKGHPSRTARFVLFNINSVFCLLVIQLSFCSKHLQNDFRYFFGNLAIADFCFSLSGFSVNCLQPFLSRAFRVPENIYVRTMLLKLPICFAISMTFAIALTSFHRYMLICKKQEYFFTKKRVFLLCISSYFLLFWPVAVFMTRAFVQKTTQAAFGVYTFALPHEMVAVAVIGTLIFLFHFYFMLNLVLFLRKNQIRLAESLNKTVDEIRKEKRLIVALLIQGTQPYVCMAPAFYSLFARSLFGENANLHLDTRYIPLLGYSIQQFCILLLNINPLFDSITTLLVVKQYSKALKLALGCHLPTDNVVHPAEERGRIAVRYNRQRHSVRIHQF